MSRTLEDLSRSLGFQPSEVLISSKAGEDVSIKAKDDHGRDQLIRFFPVRTTGESAKDAIRNLTKVWTTTGFQTNSWHTGATNRPAVDVGNEKDLGTVLKDITLRWSLSESCGRSHLAPITQIGHHDRHAYQVRPFYPLTLRDLLVREVRLSPVLLFSLVDRIWAILEFLHQPEINQPHGNLSVENIALDRNSIQEATITALDLVETPETRRSEFKRTDFQNLGLIIYRMAGSFGGRIDAVDAMQRTLNADWTHLGKQESGWKQLCKGLLDPNGFGADLAKRRGELLSSVKPQGVSPALVAALLPVTSQPPLADTPTPASSGPSQNPEGILETIRSDMERNDLGAALANLIDSWAIFDHSLAIEWADRIAGQLSIEDLSNSDILTLLERAAKPGSMVSALRLGEALIEVSPAESIVWLEQAVKAGHTKALPLVAHLKEWGGEGLVRDPDGALACYTHYLSSMEDPDISYRMAAMILREPGLSANIPKAIAALEAAHLKGNFKATDLLAQCTAHGIGLEMDEQKAFRLFSEAWNTSKKGNFNYFTASNNLGVCFAIGFGTRRDPDLARHYFKQGEIAGHEQSKRNLQNLIQSK